MLRTFLLIGLGGGLGSMLRYATALLFNKWSTQPFMIATFLVNVVGCFLIGLLFGAASKNNWLQSDFWSVLAIGFCGGFTTFSAFALENNLLISRGQNMQALLYSISSLVIGILLCRAGMMLTGGSAI